MPLYRDVMEDSGGVTALTEAEVATLDSFPEGCACTSVSLKPDMPTKQSESNESEVERHVSEKSLIGISF